LGRRPKPDGGRTSRGKETLLGRRPKPDGGRTSRGKETLLGRRPKPDGRATPRDKQILPRRKPNGRATPRDKQILPRELREKAQKPARFNSTDSLNTSMYAGPFRKPKNLTDSLGTASKVARKYRKLGSK